MNFSIRRSKKELNHVGMIQSLQYLTQFDRLFVTRAKHEMTGRFSPGGVMSC